MRQHHALARCSIKTSVEDYLRWLETRGYAVATLLARKQALGSFSRHVKAAGIHRIRSVSFRTIELYQNSLGVSAPCPASVRYLRLRTLRQFFRYLEDFRDLSDNPCKTLSLPKPPRALPRLVLSRKQVRKILTTPDRRTPKGSRDAAILELFYSSGIRLREMTHLAVNDLDLVNGVVRVEHAKFARSRVVPLGTHAAACLHDYLAQVRTPWLTAHATPPGALWLSALHPHQPIGAAALACIVRATAKAAGLRRPVSPHIWRHTCASQLVSRGAPLPHVQRLLGHRSLKTTQLYSRVAIPELRQTFEQTHPRAQERSVHVPDPIVGRKSPTAP